MGHPASLEELHAGEMAALMKLLVLTQAGITTDEFDAACRSWLAGGGTDFIGPGQRHRRDPRRRGRAQLDRDRHARRLDCHRSPGH